MASNKLDSSYNVFPSFFPASFTDAGIVQISGKDELAGNVEIVNTGYPVVPTTESIKSFLEQNIETKKLVKNLVFNGMNSPIEITHNLNSRDLIIQLYNSNNVLVMDNSNFTIKIEDKDNISVYYTGGNGTFKIVILK